MADPFLSATLISILMWVPVAINKAGLIEFVIYYHLHGFNSRLFQNFSDFRLVYTKLYNIVLYRLLLCVNDHHVYAHSSTRSDQSQAYGGLEGHSEYGCMSWTPYPAFCKTGSRDRWPKRTSRSLDYGLWSLEVWTPSSAFNNTRLRTD